MPIIKSAPNNFPFPAQANDFKRGYAGPAVTSAIAASSHSPVTIEDTDTLELVLVGQHLKGNVLGGGLYNLDGGRADSVYGSVTAISGGGA